MPKNINPFKGKKTLGNTRLPQKRAHKGNPKGARNAKERSPWGLLGLVAGVAGAWLLGAWHIGQQRGQKGRSDRVALARLLANPLKYTEHALCRMDCRHVSEREVLATLRQGTINARKSNMREFPCPKYVVDATVGLSKKNVQAVFSACPMHTDVVTVIDKDRDWACYCP